MKGARSRQPQGLEEEGRPGICQGVRGGTAPPVFIYLFYLFIIGLHGAWVHACLCHNLPKSTEGSAAALGAGAGCGERGIESSPESQRCQQAASQVPPQSNGLVNRLGFLGEKMGIVAGLTQLFLL